MIARIYTNSFDQKYLYASIVVIVITIILDGYFFNEQSIKIKENLVKPVTETIKTKAPIQQTQTNSDLAFNANIVLPSPPKQVEADAEPSKVPAANQKQASFEETIYETSKPAKSNRIDVSSTLKALTRLDSKSLQLTFPNSEYKTLQILKYMHDCVGIDTGALTTNGLIRFTDKVSQQSPLLRLASGILAKKERALITAYGNGHPLVRIYPYWFDKALGENILVNAHKQALTQLSGEYQLRGQALWLVSPTLNGQTLSQDWLLSNIQLCRS